MKNVFVKSGILAGLRSLKTKQAVGLMTTASHNLVDDNGIKLIDFDGSMLDMAWEGYATELINSSSTAEFQSKILHIVENENISNFENIQICFGRDTRPHSLELCTLAKSAASLYYKTAKIIDFGTVTSPQLHSMVYSINKFNVEALTPDDMLEKFYYKKLADAFAKLVKDTSAIDIAVDCGFGIGGIALTTLLKSINLKIEIKNFATEEDMKLEANYLSLNNGCGAEFVQKQKSMPLNFNSANGNRYVSFDGDADRVVYFWGGENIHFNLFDGDKIGCLFTNFILQNLHLLSTSVFSGNVLSVRHIQTAYANGASTNFLETKLAKYSKLSVFTFSCVCVKTGVKYLHHEAVKHDIGIYFEANGHGTVLFSDRVLDYLQKAFEKPDKYDDKSYNAIKNIYLFSQLINQTTGDAIADLLCVEAILHSLRMSKEKWAMFYTDLPSLTTKTKVKDRLAIKTNDNETKILEPAKLQEAIDELVEEGKIKDGSDLCRCFVRPSGTEDVVRIYCEGRSLDVTSWLSSEVTKVVCDILG